MNVSPGPAEIEVIRAINGMERARRGTPPTRREALALSAQYLRHAEFLPGAALRQSIAAHRSTVLLNEKSAVLSTLHRQLYEEFGSGLVTPHRKGMFFEPRRADIPYIHRDYLLGPGVIEELREIHRLLRSAIERPEGASAA